MNEISEICIANIVSWRVSQAVYRNSNRIMTKCIVTPLIISSDNGLLLGRRQAIIWTNAGILLIGPLGTNFSEILIEIHTFSFKKMHFKMSSGKCRPYCLGLNVLINLFSHVIPMQFMTALWHLRAPLLHNTRSSYAPMPILMNILVTHDRNDKEITSHTSISMGTVCWWHLKNSTIVFRLCCDIVLKFFWSFAMCLIFFCNSIITLTNYMSLLWTVTWGSSTQQNHVYISKRRLHSSY